MGAVKLSFVPKSEVKLWVVNSFVTSVISVWLPVKELLYMHFLLRKFSQGWWSADRRNLSFFVSFTVCGTYQWVVVFRTWKNTTQATRCPRTLLLADRCAGNLYEAVLRCSNLLKTDIYTLLSSWISQKFEKLGRFWSNLVVAYGTVTDACLLNNFKLPQFYKLSCDFFQLLVSWFSNFEAATRLLMNLVSWWNHQNACSKIRWAQVFI